MAERWRDERVLVTGGAGFIGSHLCEQLRARGARVTVLDDLSTGRRENLAAAEGVELLPESLHMPGLADLLAERGFGAVFHLAANAYVPPSVEDPRFDYERNLEGTFRLLEALRRAGSRAVLVNASSAAVYGDPAENPIREETALAPISPYGVSKLAAERYVAVFSRLYGLRAASARLFSTYGPRQRKQVIYDFLVKLRRDPERLVVYGDGSQRRDFNFVTDAAAGLRRIAERGRLEGEVYNVASGASVTIGELAERIAALCGLRPELAYTGAVRSGDPDEWVADVARLRRLGWSPRVGLAEGLADTWKWFQAEPDGARGPWGEQRDAVR